MQAGEMDRRITFQRYTEAQNAMGEPIETWANLVSIPTVWAKVEPVRGDESYTADKTEAEYDTRFTVRYRSDLTVKDRIVYGGQDYDIHSIAEMERQEGLMILARVQLP